MSAYTRALARSTLAAAGALALVSLSATPAAAHDQLIGSTPAAGEQLVEAPDRITLTYNSDVMQVGELGGVSAVVRVVDRDGRDWTAGQPRIDADTVTIDVAPGIPGDDGYLVQWQVVSSDGHPISGVIPFAIGDAEPLRPADLVGTPAGGADAEPDADPESAPAAPSGADAPNALRTLAIGAGGAAIAVALFAGITLLTRRRASAAPAHDTEETTES